MQVKPYRLSLSKGSSQITTVTATGQLYSQSNSWGPYWDRELRCPTTIVYGDRVAPNPWSYTKTELYYLQGSLLDSGPSLTTTTSGILGPPEVNHPNVSSYSHEARAKALEKLNEKVRGSLDLATSLAESGQTVKMLNLVERLSSALQHTRRSYLREIWAGHRSRKWRRQLPRFLKRWQRGLKTTFGRDYAPLPVKPGLVSRVSSAGANGWLEFTYGWKPLMSDIYGVASNVVGHVRKYLTFFSAMGKQVINENDVVAGPSGHAGRCKVSGFASCRYGLTLTPNHDSGLQTWTSLNPLSVAYELLPYSFVLDWIIDIGGYLRNLETALLYSVSFVRGYMSTLWTYTSASTFTSNTRKWGGYTSTLIGQCSYSATKFDRVVLSGYPFPQPPRFNTDLGSSRLLSTASLLRQRLK